VPLPVSIFVGGPPALILSAIAPLPENVPELMFASFLQGKKLKTTTVKNHPHKILTECDFALLGHAKPRERRLEGPFGDHFGYYSLEHDFPVFHCHTLYHRKGAIWPATVVGKPLQEDIYIGNYLQKLFSPLFPILMPQVKQLHTFGEAGFHALAAARLTERYEKEALTAAFRILGEGQLSLTKCLFLTDAPIDITDIRLLLESILARFSSHSGLIILSNTSNDTLDYTGPKLNRGSKMILIGTGMVKRELPREFQGHLPPGIKTAIPFAPGCLVLDGTSDCESLTHHPDFLSWPLLILVDDAKKTTESALEFLWTVFTRFEPARDLYSKTPTVKRNALQFEPPLLIDARMKASYPKEVEPDSETVELVDQKWHRYFQ
jgi:4-hydroxybenzoate decarboxylase subunit C